MDRRSREQQSRRLADVVQGAAWHQSTFRVRRTKGTGTLQVRHLVLQAARELVRPDGALVYNHNLSWSSLEGDVLGANYPVLETATAMWRSLLLQSRAPCIISMANACKNHYELLHAASAPVLTESFIGLHADAMAKSHAFIDDLALWIERLITRQEVIIVQAALRE